MTKKHIFKLFRHFGFENSFCWFFQVLVFKFNQIFIFLIRRQNGTAFKKSQSQVDRERHTTWVQVALKPTEKGNSHESILLRFYWISLSTSMLVFQRWQLAWVFFNKLGQRFSCSQLFWFSLTMQNFNRGFLSKKKQAIKQIVM